MILILLQECKDEWKKRCRVAVKSGQCEHPDKITIYKKKCAKSCGFCKQQEVLPHFDRVDKSVKLGITFQNCKNKFEDSICQIYDRFGWCNDYQSYMSEWCAKTCDFCKKN
ncbi:unnamed protein product [Nippostrongylus brasiliensis]|uniref:ShKT domain-containing protein n=1 Tax=Nippostrongylus brasiliensis TaxID=27835 RepID=A0A0N4Y8P5_NIPBR|nr:unnamed protein product [Nippostrongylus brasiliensis]